VTADSIKGSCNSFLLGRRHPWPVGL